MWQILRVSSIILGAVVGSGIFFLPYTLSFVGINGFLGLILVSIIFLILTLFFTEIEESPFLFITKHTNKFFGFFVNYSYWIVSWLSSIVIINEVASVFNVNKTIFSLCLLAIVVLANLFGNNVSVKAEVTLSIIKTIPLIIVPILYFYHAPSSYSTLGTFSTKQLLKSIPLCSWCFGGVESLSIIGTKFKKLNAKKVILFTFIFIIFLYVMNLLSVWRFVGFNFSSIDINIYTTIMASIFIHPAASIILKSVVFIEGISNLNTWVLSSTVCAYDGSKNGFFPSLLQKENKWGTCYISLIASTILLVPLILLISFNNIASNIISFTNISCGIWFLFYFMFLLSFTIHKYRAKQKVKAFISLSLCVFFAIVFFHAMNSLIGWSIFSVTIISSIFFYRAWCYHSL